MYFKKGDKVKVLSGKYRGKSGDIVFSLPGSDKVVVSGVNVVKKHIRKSQKHPQGGIIEFEKPISSSSVQILCSKCGKPTRIGFSGVSKEKTRVCKKCNSKI